MKKFFNDQNELLQALESNKTVYWKTDNFIVEKFVKRNLHQWRIVNQKTEEDMIVFHNFNRIAGKITDYYYKEE